MKPASVDPHTAGFWEDAMAIGSEANRQALAWPHGIVSVESLGGMVGPTVFVLPDGRQIAPFQIAPWADEAGTEDIPPILQRLRGEWPCVPFGSDGDRAAANGWPVTGVR